MESLNVRLHELQEICAEVSNWRDVKGEFESPEEERRYEAQCFQNAGDHFMVGAGTREMAKLCFRIAVELDPTWAKPLIKLAHMVADLGDHEQAIELYTECFRLGCRGLDLGWKGENPCFEIGMCYVALHRPEDAEAYYLAGLAGGHDNDSFYHQLSALWHQEGAYERATKYYRQWIEFREAGGDDSVYTGIDTDLIRRALDLAQAAQPLARIGHSGRVLFLKTRHVPRLPPPPCSRGKAPT